MSQYTAEIHKSVLITVTQWFTKITESGIIAPAVISDYQSSDISYRSLLATTSIADCLHKEPQLNLIRFDTRDDAIRHASCKRK